MSSMKDMILQPGREMNEQELLDWMIEHRRWVHQHAELGYKEVLTSQYIEEQLQNLAVDNIVRIGDTGLVATIEGTDKEKATVALRADMDGLPLNEETDLS